MITRFEGTTKIADVTSSTYDTGWVNIEWTSNFKDYADVSNNGAQVRRIGNIVYLRGAAAPTQEIDASTSLTVMGNVPARFRPDKNTQFVCQASGVARCMIAVYNNGNFGVARYGTDTLSSIPTSARLPFNISYVAGDN